ncbi:hypothetical protein [Metabacillus arenae]|uniref:Uncharacterized protein n=1 Tax=Metabacillus arenae TaxID=2771434 RepID=A0A926NJF1_9BACI|nr:hypothetical protein [Metabacillus arenae]MBD1379212.1 hypothetical protein [Metabacillus arenae]
MSKLMVKITSLSSAEYEDLQSYCQRISKKNNSNLYKLEKYLGKSLMVDEDLMMIRDIILTVSADINRLPDLIIADGETNEGL